MVPSYVHRIGNEDSILRDDMRIDSITLSQSLPMHYTNQTTPIHVSIQWKPKGNSRTGLLIALQFVLEVNTDPTDHTETPSLVFWLNAIVPESNHINNGSYVRKGVCAWWEGLWPRRKGISASCLPYKRTAPSWLKTTSAEVEASVCRLAKKGLTPSQIGVLLRDQKGIGQVKAVTGSKILRILKKNGRGWV